MSAGCSDGRSHTRKPGKKEQERRKMEDRPLSLLFPLPRAQEVGSSRCFMKVSLSLRTDLALTEQVTGAWATVTHPCPKLCMVHS